MTLAPCDDITDMLLSSFVQCVQKLVKLFLGLTAEHRQQLLVLSEGHHVGTNGISLFCAQNTGLIKFTDKSGILGIQIVHQEHVIWLDNSRVNKIVVKICTQK